MEPGTQPFGLSVSTVLTGLKGSAAKLETLWTLSRYFGVPWFLLFDLERKYIVQVRDDGTGIEIDGTQINGETQRQRTI